MSEAIAFDTHRYVKRLTESGFTERQAETLADEQVALLNTNLATKSDVEALRQETKIGLEALRHETKTGLEALRQETKAEIAKVEAGVEALRQETKADFARVDASIEAAKSELIKWMFGAMVAVTGIFAAIVKLT